jgi:AbrB family looped-hinge helix DNA binding protein
MTKSETVTTTLAEGGRIVIPASYRKALGVKTGDKIILRLEKGEVHVISRAEARRRAQEYVTSRIPKGVSLVDELIRDRRKEADD